MIDVYTCAGCPRCVQVKNTLSSHNIEFSEKRIGLDIDRDSVVGLFPSQRSLPILVVEARVVSLDEVLP
jgi:glutaredoxin